MNNIVDYGFGGENEENHFIRYNHQGVFAGKFTVGKGEGKTEVAFKHLFWDIDSIRTGWMWIQPDMAPVIQWNEQPNVWKSNPGQTQLEMDRYKKGFNVDVFIKDHGLLTWSAASWGCTQAFGLLMAEVGSQRANNQGKVPVVHFEGSKEVKFKTGASSTIPTLSVVKWVVTDEFLIEPTPPYEEPEAAQPELATGSDLDFDDEIPF